MQSVMLFTCVGRVLDLWNKWSLTLPVPSLCFPFLTQRDGLLHSRHLVNSMWPGFSCLEPRRVPRCGGRCAAFLARSAQALFDPDVTRIQLFVDDTLAQSRGTQDERRLSFACILLWWSVLGANVAWQTGAIGAGVEWIVASINHLPRMIKLFVT